ncbi:sodium-translocating pyrophosphatase [Acetobacterium paludosum]|uniref:Putative K(+)-stimulated pyrophosphate-energized sodium pump n=1 Tax=Acetobacterium paludosum TaxID=52693 RepID=A0A923HX36_9FIRM|nr:sodium-translocating pyrophosphatase [Acetobacterium paludosum]MBC3888790.1 sodium-translocating pyrophosphatase [Acetobacterium paludosum]
MTIFIVTVAIIALLFALYLSTSVLKESMGNDKMKEISVAIQEGAMAFLNREYKTMLPIAIVIIVLLILFTEFGIASAIAFAIGAVFSALAGYMGMYIATRANARTTNAAQSSLKKALVIAFKGGSVMGMGVVGLGLLGVSLLYIFVAKGNPDMIPAIDSFAFGASLIALFARIGGGIFTKAADVGADLVGKVEAGIPEDDPRNPAVIADNVGDNVGDVAGMGADLFESFAATSIAAMLLGSTLLGSTGVMLPMMLGACGIVASIIGTLFIYTGNESNPQACLNRSLYSSFLLSSIAAFLLTKYMLPDHNLAFYIAIQVGLIANIVIGKITEYFTSSDFSPVKKIAESSNTGAATNVIYGFSVGLESTGMPILVIIAVVAVAYFVPGGGEYGFYGIALAAMGMLSMAGTIVAIDAYGPIADNAGGIAEMAGLDPKVRKVTDQLDSVGNTTAAIAKGFAIGSAAITAIALFSAFAQRAELKTLDVLNPVVMVGLLFGAMIPFLFCAYSMRAVSTAAFDMIKEVRRQFREIPGLLEGKAKADSKKCIDISTKAAIRQMILPGLLAPVSIFVVGFGIAIFSPENALLAIGGMLVGGTASGVLLALTMANAGGAWDNAKKYIEGGAQGGKGSEAHVAAVVGDTIGDPFKDTSGPSLNAVIKVMGTLSLIIAPIIAGMIH